MPIPEKNLSSNESARILCSSKHGICSIKDFVHIALVKGLCCLLALPMTQELRKSLIFHTICCNPSVYQPYQVQIIPPSTAESHNLDKQSKSSQSSGPQARCSYARLRARPEKLNPIFPRPIHQWVVRRSKRGWTYFGCVYKHSQKIFEYSLAFIFPLWHKQQDSSLFALFLLKIVATPHCLSTHLI